MLLSCAIGARALPGSAVATRWPSSGDSSTRSSSRTGGDARSRWPGSSPRSRRSSPRCSSTGRRHCGGATARRRAAACRTGARDALLSARVLARQPPGAVLARHRRRWPSPWSARPRGDGLLDPGAGEPAARRAAHRLGGAQQPRQSLLCARRSVPPSPGTTAPTSRQSRRRHAVSRQQSFTLQGSAQRTRCRPARSCGCEAQLEGIAARDAGRVLPDQLDDRRVRSPTTSRSSQGELDASTGHGRPRCPAPTRCSADATPRGDGAGEPPPAIEPGAGPPPADVAPARPRRPGQPGVGRAHAGARRQTRTDNAGPTGWTVTVQAAAVGQPGRHRAGQPAAHRR